MWALGYIKYTKRIVWSVSAHQMMKLKTGSERRRTVVCVCVCVCVCLCLCARYRVFKRGSIGGQLVACKCYRGPGKGFGEARFM